MQLTVTCNTEDDVLFQNIAQNSLLPNEWVKSEQEHDGHAVIVGGGPSLLDTIESIRWRKSIGQTIFALNGAARTLKEHGVEVDYTVVLDARAFNVRFLGYSKKYLLSSQCEPSLFKAEPDAIIWHPAIDGIDAHIPETDRDFCLIGGGTTVGLSTMCLAYAMGYRKMHLYGFDSSHREKSHAYNQPENENEPICRMTVYGKTFKTSWTMAKQAELFPTVCDNLIDLGCIITVDGDGLIPHIVRNMPKPIYYKDIPETQESQDLIVAFCWRGDLGWETPTKEYAPIMLESVRKHLPNAHVIHITYPDHEALEGVDEVLRVEKCWPDKLTQYRDKKQGELDRADWLSEIYADILQRGKNCLFIGTDVVIQKDINKVFQLDFDVASSRYPRYTRTDGAFCWDVQFAKPSAVEFYRDVTKYYQSRPEIQDMGEGIQTSTTMVSDCGKYKVLNLDFDDFCNTPENEADDVSKAAIVHYRGPRKQWMIKRSK